MQVALGTDVGAGTSFSMFATMNEAYKVQALQKRKLSAVDAFYLATLGGARAIGQERWIGNFTPGKEADFVVLDPGATPLLCRRCKGLPNTPCPLPLVLPYQGTY